MLMFVQSLSRHLFGVQYFCHCGMNRGRTACRNFARYHNISGTGELFRFRVRSFNCGTNMGYIESARTYWIL